MTLGRRTEATLGRRTEATLGRRIEATSVRRIEATLVRRTEPRTRLAMTARRDDGDDDDAPLRSTPARCRSRIRSTSPRAAASQRSFAVVVAASSSQASRRSRSSVGTRADTDTREQQISRDTQTRACARSRRRPARCHRAAAAEAQGGLGRQAREETRRERRRKQDKSARPCRTSGDETRENQNKSPLALVGRAEAAFLAARPEERLDLFKFKNLVFDTLLRLLPVPRRRRRRRGRDDGGARRCAGGRERGPRGQVREVRRARRRRPLVGLGHHFFGDNVEAPNARALRRRGGVGRGCRRVRGGCGGDPRIGHPSKGQPRRNGGASVMHHQPPRCIEGLPNRIARIMYLVKKKRYQ